MNTLQQQQQPSSILVNVAEHAELRLVRILSSSSTSSPTFESDCESCIANADAPGFIRTILNDQGAITSLFGLETMEECIGAFSLLAALLDRVEDSKLERMLAGELADAISLGTFPSSKRIGMLCALYNLRSSGGEKCVLLGRIVGLCGEEEREKLLEGGELWDVLEVESVEKMLGEWGVTVEERRGLYRIVGEAYGRLEGEGGVVRRQRYLLLDVGTYTDPAGLDKEALVAARDAAIGAIRDPVTLFAEQRGMLTLPAIAALQTNPATAPLHTLLQIIQEGKLTDYQSHLQTNPTLLTTHSLNPTTLTHNMRLLSLCSLASEHEEIPYDAIAETLQIPTEEVESWVIAAVQADLIMAKMDQLSRVVMVEQCVVRKFGVEEWRKVKVRLDCWKENVRSVLEGLRSGKAAGAMM